MARIITPLDHFLYGLGAWLSGAWFVWAAAILVVLCIVVPVAVSRSRNRGRDRIPQYRRQRG
jgi:hypothetical protein